MELFIAGRGRLGLFTGEVKANGFNRLFCAANVVSSPMAAMRHIDFLSSKANIALSPSIISIPQVRPKKFLQKNSC